MKIAQCSLAWVACLGLPLLAACYQERGTEPGQTGPTNGLSDAAGGAAPSAADSGKRPVTIDGDAMNSRDDGSAGRGGSEPAVPSRPAGRGQATPPKNDSTPARGGSGGCGAIRGDAAPVYADTSAFTGVGGAGFNLVGVCDRCGWKHQADDCQSLVYSVPTGGTPEYYPCLDVSLEWVTCVETMSCICGGDIPEACREIKARLDACF